jgi:hypothetical protein
MLSASDDCRVSNRISCPRWLCANMLGLLFDVSLFCKFPDTDAVLGQIQKAEQRILSLTSIAVLTPGNTTSIGLNVKELDSTKTENDFARALHEQHGVVRHAITTLMKRHDDVCKGTFPPAQSAEEIYNNIKSLLDRFDIYSKCTKTYMTRIPIQKDDIVAISTELAAGMFALSYDDVSQYKEVIELRKGGVPVKTLTMIISSRKENVIEGNYDVEVSLEGDEVVLQYTKRQNLAEKILELGISRNGYAFNTQRSVDSTLHKLAYAGLYGPDAVSDEGCYGRPESKCAEYNTFESGEACQHDLQCQSNKCVSVPGCVTLFTSNCNHQCV